jgi:hypothetical protein
VDGLLQKDLLSYWTKNFRLNLNYGINISYLPDTHSEPIQSRISTRNNLVTVDVLLTVHHGTLINQCQLDTHS